MPIIKTVVEAAFIIVAYETGCISKKLKKMKWEGITKIAYVLGNHLVLLSMYSHCPLYVQIPKFEAFKLMSENCNMWKTIIMKANMIQTR